jgi:hypothetical protein
MFVLKASFVPMWLMFHSDHSYKTTWSRGKENENGCTTHVTKHQGAGP